MKRLIVVVVLFTLTTAVGAVAHTGKEKKAGLPAWTERVRLSGTVGGDFSWTEKSDPADRDSDSRSYLFISTVELGVEADFTDWLRGNIVFLAEHLGTADESDVVVDEVTLSLERGGFYLVFGKRAQPFGVYENHLVADPMTQDAYETNRPGLTAGYGGPVGLNVSFTVYRGEEMMAHLFESELFDTDAVTRAADPAGNDVSSYIVSASVEPWADYLTLFGGFVSEPGTGRRNNTANVGFSLALNGEQGLRFDAEYMKALSREKYAGFDRMFREGVLSVTAAYEFVMRERGVLGGALFAERRAHVVSEPLEVAVRYEHFNDDGMAKASQAWSVKDRYGVGARYSFYQDPESGLAAYVAIEYRHTDFRLHPSQAVTRADSNDEFFARLGVTF